MQQRPTRGDALGRIGLYLIGELRDPESIRTALSAAETGHLVLSTLHTQGAAKSVNRIVDVFPTDQQAQIQRLQKKQGDFGCFLQLAHNWANFESTKKSYELWQRHVTPVINGANTARETALNWAKDNKERFIGAAMNAAMQTIQKHHEDEAKKGKKAAE